MKISGESIDSRILAEFGLQGGRRLAKTLEGLIPTNKEDLEQERFEAKWSSVGALTACQDMAEKGVEGILRGQNRSETRVGRVRLDNHPDHERERTEENKEGKAKT